MVGNKNSLNVGAALLNLDKLFSEVGNKFH